MCDYKSYFQIFINSRSHLSQHSIYHDRFLFQTPVRAILVLQANVLEVTKGKFISMLERETFDYILERF